MPKYTEFDDISGSMLFDREKIGERMRAERRAAGIESTGSIAGLMRSLHRIPISARQYQDMENGRNPRGNTVHLWFEVVLAFVDIVDPPGGILFARNCMSDAALRILADGAE